MIYIYQGAEFTEEQVAKAAANLGISTEEYISKYKLTVKEDTVGKTSTADQGAPAEGMLAPTLSEASSLDDLDLVSVETAKSGTSANTLTTEVETGEKEQPSFLQSVASVGARGFLSAARGIQAIPEALTFMAMEAYDPSKTPQERIARRKAVAYMPKPAGMLAAPSTSDFDRAIEVVSRGVKQREDADILSAIQSGNYIDAAQMAVEGAVESAPSLLAAASGVGGIALFGGSVVGNKFDEELEADPDQTLLRLTANSVATGVNEMAFEMVTKKLLFGAKILKNKGLAEESAEFLRRGLTSAALKFTGKTAGEGLSEAATEGVNMIIDKVSLGKEVSNKEIVHRLFEAGTIGMVMGGGVSSLSSLGPKRSLDRSLAENVLYSNATQTELGRRANLMSRAAYDMRTAETAEEKKLFMDVMAREEAAIINLKNRANFELETLQGQDLKNYAKNRDEIYSLQNTLRNKEASDKTKKEAQARIVELENANKDIVNESVELAYDKNITIAQEEAKNLNVAFKEFNNDAEFNQYVESVRGQAPPSNIDGVYMRDRNEILINRQRAIENRMISVGSHELLHAIMTKTMKSGGDNAVALGKAMLDQIDNVINNVQFQDTEFFNRVMAYKNKYKKQGRVVGEEILTLFSDALAKGDIRPNETMLTKLGDKVRQVLYTAGMNRRFDKPQDVFNFIKDFNTSMSKGYVDRSVKRIAAEGATGRILVNQGDIDTQVYESMSVRQQELVQRNKDILAEAGSAANLTDEQKAEMAKNAQEIKNLKEAEAPQVPKGVDPESAKRSELTQKIWTEEFNGKSDTEKAIAFEKIKEQQMPKINQVVNKIFKERPDLKEQAITKEGFKFDLIYGIQGKPSNSLLRLVQTYDPKKGGVLAQWIADFLPQRAKGVLDTRVNTATQSAASLDIIETTEFADEFDFDVPVRAQRRAASLELKKDLISSINENVKLKLLRKLPLYYTREFKSVLQTEFRQSFAAEIKQMWPADNKPKGTKLWTEYVNRNIAGIYETFTVEKVIAATKVELRDMLLDSENNLKPLEEVRDQLIEYYTVPKNTVTGEISPQRKTQHRTQLANQVADAIGFEASADMIQSDQEVADIFRFNQKLAAQERKMAKLVIGNADIVTGAVDVLSDKIRNINLLGLESATARSYRARFSRAAFKLEKLPKNLNILQISDFIRNELGIENVDAYNIVKAQTDLLIYVAETENIDKPTLKKLYQNAYDSIKFGIPQEEQTTNDYGFEEYYAKQEGLELSDDLYSITKNQLIDVLRDQDALPPGYNKMTKGELMDYMNNYDQFSAKRAKQKFDEERTDFDIKFNEILEQRSGIASDKIFSDAYAHQNAKKKRYQYFIPSSAEDFTGLLYKFLPKGKQGDEAKKFFDEHISREYAKGIYNATTYKTTLFRDYKALRKALDINTKYLQQPIGPSGLTKEQAIRLYIWEANGELPKFDVTGTTQTLTPSEIDEVVNAIMTDKKLKTIAHQVNLITKRHSVDGIGYVPYDANWQGGTIATDLINYANGARRKHYLKQWKTNVDQIFTGANKNKIKVIYGKNFLSDLQNSLDRQWAGKNNLLPGDSNANKFTGWVNGSIGTIMFFNRKSALLQMLSFTNFINVSDNNPMKAAKAFANVGQYGEDLKALLNSNYLKNRRDGVEIDIEADEIARAAAGKTGITKLFNKVIKAGYIPTKYADSFAIAFGGATFYRNRINTYLEQGMEQAQAEERAMLDFQEKAEESQQSARPDRISRIQTGPLSRMVLAFANTPMQYARIVKRAGQDLIMRRGDAKEHISKIAYYGFIQSMIFNGIQNLTDYAFFDDEMDEEEEKQFIRALNGMVDGFLRGTGLGGNVFAAGKNLLVELSNAFDYKKGKFRDDAEVLRILLNQGTAISPPLNSKLRKLQKSLLAFYYKDSRKEMKKKGFTYDNPALVAAGQMVSATTNVPLDRVVRTVDDMANVAFGEMTSWQRLGLFFGWDKWTLGIEKPKKKRRGSGGRGSGRAKG